MAQRRKDTAGDPVLQNSGFNGGQAAYPAMVPAAQKQAAGLPVAAQAAAQASAPAHRLNRGGGLKIETLDELNWWANCALKCGIKAKGIHELAVRMQVGMELGMLPIESLSSVAVINGRASVWGEALIGLARLSGAWVEAGYREWFTGTPMTDDWTAHFSTQRVGQPEPQVDSFSWADAKRAGLAGKNVWATYPRDMLMGKARGRNIKRQFAECIRGFDVVTDHEMQAAAQGVVESAQVPAATLAERLAAGRDRLAALPVMADDMPPPPTPDEDEPAEVENDDPAADEADEPEAGQGFGLKA